MATALGVIKKFVSYLDNSDKVISGAAEAEKVLDAAVQAATANFSSLKEVVGSLIGDIKKSASGSSFLRHYCGIELDNADTGAITGADAGSGPVKTAESVVPESGAAVYPDGSSWSCHGLTLELPEKSTLSADEQSIVTGLCSWWMRSALELIEESYGLSFTEADASVDTMSLVFANEPANSALAWVRLTYDTATGEANKLELYVNMYYYDGVDISTDVNGRGSNTSAYLDRTIAHELVHAVTAANIGFLSRYPMYLYEGLAELVHGIDDERGYWIKKLVNNPDSLSKALGSFSGSGSEPYAAGYILLRYLASQGVKRTIREDEHLPAGLSYNDDESRVLVSSSFGDMLVWLNKDSGVNYEKTATAIDASECSKELVLVGRGTRSTTIVGGRGATAIWGGGSAGDMLYSGSGRTIFWFGSGDGQDTILKYAPDKDMIYFYGNDFSGYDAGGSTLKLKAGQAVLNVSGGTNKKLQLQLGDTAVSAVFARTDVNNNIAYDSSLELFFGSERTTDTLTVSNGTKVASLWGNMGLYANADVLDASKVTNDFIGIGSNFQSTTIKAGSGSNALWGGSGEADTLRGNESGSTHYWFGAADGNDTICGSNGHDDIFVYDESINPDNQQLAMQGKDLVIYDGSSSLTIKDWSETGSVSTILTPGGAVYGITTEGGEGPMLVRR